MSVCPFMPFCRLQPFQMSAVCAAPVPRTEGVASIEGPYCLMNTADSRCKISASDNPLRAASLEPRSFTCNKAGLGESSRSAHTSNAAMFFRRAMVSPCAKRHPAKSHINKKNVPHLLFKAASHLFLRIERQKQQHNVP